MLRGLGRLIITIGFAVCVGACLRPDSIDVTYDINAPKIFLGDAPRGEHYIFRQALLISELTMVENCVLLKQGDALLIPVWPDYTKLMQTEAGYYIDVKGKKLRLERPTILVVQVVRLK